MGTIKRKVIDMIKNMPDDVTLEEIMEGLYVKQKILKGIADQDSGHFYSHEEVKEMVKRWERH